MNNSCATIAIVNALGNIPGVTVGPILTNLFEFAPGMDPLVSGYIQFDPLLDPADSNMAF